MAVGPGTRLGPYDILSPLGAGGMGEVYKAQDTRLGRTVAIKVLPAVLAEDPQFRDRFEREAKTISQLDHPNICALYDVGVQDGTSFLVLQYLEGETVADRLGRSDRPLPVGEALTIATQIADALTAAHRAGIVHRDLKPGNVMLTKSGAKLLDFGLAKTGVPAVSGTGGTMLPTTPVNITAQGTILGTFQYMAPEQLEGADADARTDIFAFGAIVYEMVTGRKAFEGKSPVSLIGAILERDPPPLSTIAPTVPASLDRVLRRCLAKDPDRRWQSASDLAHEMRWIAESASAPEASVVSATAAAPPVPATSKAAIGWKIATVASVLAALIGLAAAYITRSKTPEVVRFFIAPPEKASFVSGGRPGASAAISPDGRRIAFTVRDSSQKISLWVRSIDALTAQPLPGTDDALFPFWSPDSRSIGYFARNKLMKIDAIGGPPQTLCDAPGARGGAWSRDGVILFGGGPGGPGAGSPLSRISSAGGQPVLVTKLSAGQLDHRFPSFLPDGRHFLYYSNLLGGTAASPSIYLGSLASEDSRPIVSAESSGVYSAGHLLYVRQSTLLAQPFNLTSFEVSGDPVPVAEQVTRNFAGLIAFSVSDGGALVYGLGPSETAPGTMSLELTWIDRKGKVIETLGPPGPYRGIDLSPDGKRVAVHRHDGPGGDVWIIDASRSERFTFDPAVENESPIWSPDGRWLAFGARRAQKPGLYRKASNLAGSEELLLETGAPLAPTSWSRDGQSIVYSTGGGGGPSDLFTLPLSKDRKPVPLVNTPATEIDGQISPNGKWLAYQSTEEGARGGRPNIYVRPFATGTGKYQVSTNGGAFPRWRGDGRELFYLETLDPITGGDLMSVDIGPSDVSLDRGSPRALFSSGYIGFLHAPSGLHNPFAVSPDGQRFLIPRPLSAVTSDQVDAPVAVVLNWAPALKRN